MKVVVVPCLRDNYAYLASTGAPDAAGKINAFVVDPSEAAPVEAALAREGWTLVAVLATHHHLDHVGGITELANAHAGLDVYAYEGDRDRIDGITQTVRDGDSRTIAGIDLDVRHIPGHTMGAIAWFAHGNPPAVFTGDTMFVAGCGRLFEGTPADMYRSLVEVLGSFPDETQVYCGHEYTESNLRFAAHVEPSNDAVRAWQQRAANLRANGSPTVPSRLGDERRINPFMRSHTESVRAFTKLDAGTSPSDVLGAVRRAKDTF
ncbi:MAG: hydroxyacylglutathione hydrolase [Polyangiaceae bacterium]